MKHSQKYAKAVIAIVTLGLAAACADSNVAAPTATTELAAFKAPANFAKVGGEKVFLVNNAEGATVRIGKHVINFPAGAICDLTSGYGATYWDKPCVALRGSIAITATVFEGKDGEPYIDFQPAMRFAPNKEVILFMKDGKSDVPRQLNVKYCTNLGLCTDESLNDSSLKPFRVGNSSIIGRRLKHFSGYTIGYGEPCNGSVTFDGGSWMCNDSGMARRSGYMVASGQDDDKSGAKNDDNKEGKKSEQEQQ